VSRVELVVVGRDGLSWKTRDQARLSDRGISVRSGLDSAGPPWQRLLGYFASGTEGKTLARGPAISALDWGRARKYRSVGRRREDSRRDGSPF
jgi:hypothetical protein